MFQIQIQKLYFLSNMFKYIQYKLCRAFISTNNSIKTINKGTNITVQAKHKTVGIV